MVNDFNGLFDIRIDVIFAYVRVYLRVCVCVRLIVCLYRVYACVCLCVCLSEKGGRVCVCVCEGRITWMFTPTYKLSNYFV